MSLTFPYRQLRTTRPAHCLGNVLYRPLPLVT